MLFFARNFLYVRNGPFPRHPRSLLCKGRGARTRSHGRAGDRSGTSP
jgi:hypothetical protein